LTGHRMASSVAHCYRLERWSVRRYVAIRNALCPFAAIVPFVPLEGSVIDLGSGMGYFALLMALESPSRRVLGVDWDVGRVATARRVANGLPNARFEIGDIADASWWSRIDTGSVQAVTCIDLLYLLPMAAQERVLSQVSRVLAPGGVVLVKRMRRHPRWKWCWYRWQEHIAVEIIRLTKGRGLWFDSSDNPLRMFASNWSRQIIDLGRGFVYPHELIVLRKEQEDYLAVSDSGGRGGVETNEKMTISRRHVTLVRGTK